ncbi:MAG: hypothetical protein N2663_08075 [Chlorobi bacterium]|nr:hypothetical protein [Chlorobiota bacterium]
MSNSAIRRNPAELFEDFLDITLVPSVRRGVPPGSFLPAEFVAQTPHPVTVHHHDDGSHSPMAIVLEKDSYGVVRTIRVHCACGSSAAIILEYDTDMTGAEGSVGNDTPINTTLDRGENP